MNTITKTHAPGTHASIVKLKLAGVRTINIAEQLAITARLVERAWKIYRANNPNVKARVGGAVKGSKLIRTAGGDTINIK